MSRCSTTLDLASPSLEASGGILDKHVNACGESMHTVLSHGCMCIRATRGYIGGMRVLMCGAIVSRLEGRHVLHTCSQMLGHVSAYTSRFTSPLNGLQSFILQDFDACQCVVRLHRPPPRRSPARLHWFCPIFIDSQTQLKIQRRIKDTCNFFVTLTTVGFGRI